MPSLTCIMSRSTLKLSDCLTLILRTISSNTVSFAIGLPVGISHRLYPAGSSRIQDIINWKRKCSTTADSSRTHLCFSRVNFQCDRRLLFCSVKGSIFFILFKIKINSFIHLVVCLTTVQTTSKASCPHLAV
jgi:hypothetical protein